MKIKRDSWVAGLDNPFGLGDPSTNLCELLRGMLIWTPVKALVAVVVLYIYLLAPVVLVVATIAGHHFSLMAMALWWPGFILLVTATFLALIALVSVAESAWLHPPGLIKEAYWAFKEKYCPLVEWT